MRRGQALLALGFLLGGALASAQPPGGKVSAPRRTGCLDSIPSSALRRVPVYVTAELPDSVIPTTALLSSLDLFAQTLAAATRTLLGAGPNQLPPGEPGVSWRDLEHRLAVVSHRGGRTVTAVRAPEWLSEQSVGDAGARVLAQAVQAATSKGESVLFTDEIPRDSVLWFARLEAAIPRSDGSTEPPMLRSGFPVFTVLAPPRQPPDVERMRTNFPMTRIRGYSGAVRLQFVIDTIGQAVPSTIKGVWPAGEKRLMGAPYFAYDSLVRLMSGTVQQARFIPARIGGCTASQMVQQAFNYLPSR